MFLVKADILYCRKLSRYHGDIQPKLVMLAKDGTLFLNDILNFTPDNENGYKRMLHEKGYFSLLSPEALDDLNRKNEHPDYDQDKCDVWSIALTVLTVSTDTDVSSNGLQTFYRRNGNEWTVNKDVIESTLQKMQHQGKRSETLVSTLRIMLSEKAEDRPSLYQILEFLRVASV